MKKKFLWLLLSALTGFFCGCASSLLLYLLNLATNLRTQNHFLVLFLPLIGLVIGWVYHHYGSDVETGNNLIIEEIQNPKKILPFKMAPLILSSTFLTHLFGGSAGREGVVVQMGATLADTISKFFKAQVTERKKLLAAGAGAGFGSALGTPFAGIFFGMEMIYSSSLPTLSQAFALIECLIASFAAYLTTMLLKTEHSKFPQIDVPQWSFKLFLFLILIGLIFGGTARFFNLLLNTVSKLNSRWIQYKPLKPFVGGLILVLLYWLEGSFRYEGLGLQIIQDAFVYPGYLRDVVLKTLFTVITLSFGFKGGEFIPLVFIGTVLGSFLAASFQLPITFLAGLGFAAVFGGASHTPIACTVMAMELFGMNMGPLALLVCLISSLSSGKIGIYKSQK